MTVDEGVAREVAQRVLDTWPAPDEADDEVVICGPDDLDIEAALPAPLVIEIRPAWPRSAQLVSEWTGVRQPGMSAVCHPWHMRMHIELDDALVREIDAIAGERGRSAYVRAALSRALEADRRAEALLSVAGALAGSDHEWDADPAEWVRAQRHSDSRRSG